MKSALSEIVKFLLGCDPDVKLQRFRGISLLQFACEKEFDDSNIGAGIQIIKAIYDVHPEAIEDNGIVSDFYRFHQEVQEFLDNQLFCARRAKDHRLMTTPDDNGQLPLHTALQNNVRLGSIKLLVKGNPSAIRNFDNNGLTPLHIACQHHCSPGVVQYLLGLDTRTLRAVDFHNNTALHYACHGAKYETIALLLENHDAASVSKRSTHDKLPIELLWESDAVEDRESIDYTDTIFRLLKAYPETLSNVGTQLQLTLATCPNQIGNGKKRKYGSE